ncbi:hypothetical protein AYL99_05187 [Fonsecaea erecta]|uniref:Uncharacterized protein n=1 Tax=Fonsecaea erecta TaxID=1367422 RepID=A0A178ZME1_9EURO|nr:hypothetical protein AYL99_05187 [Fonsecaea erecta]OAP60185.1 hypothetical protein AYL99_05187 [Fonsecaea erecta]
MTSHGDTRKRLKPVAPSTARRAGQAQSASQPLVSFSASNGVLRARESIARIEALVRAVPATSPTLSAFSLMGRGKSLKVRNKHLDELDERVRVVWRKLEISPVAKSMMRHFVYATEVMREQAAAYTRRIKELKAHANYDPDDEQQDEIDALRNLLTHVQCLEIPGAPDCLTYLTTEHLVDKKFTTVDLLELADELVSYLKGPELGSAESLDHETSDEDTEIKNADIGLSRGCATLGKRKVTVDDEIHLGDDGVRRPTKQSKSVSWAIGEEPRERNAEAGRKKQAGFTQADPPSTYFDRAGPAYHNTPWTPPPSESGPRDRRQTTEPAVAGKSRASNTNLSPLTRHILWDSWNDEDAPDQTDIDARREAGADALALVRYSALLAREDALPGGSARHRPQPGFIVEVSSPDEEPPADSEDRDEHDVDGVYSNGGSEDMEMMDSQAEGDEEFHPDQTEEL